MIFAKEAITLCVTIGMGIGCCAGGLSAAWQEFSYRKTLEDPSFLYLVDESGNPVRQNAN